jgi:DNA-binding transcriptional MerR regulator
MKTSAVHHRVNMNTNAISDASAAQRADDLPSFRSGVAARLAGLPVETLRVWERRYALSDTQRSAHGQRLYSADQVRHLGLLKQLVDQGHPIGSLAGLPVERLEALVNARAAGMAAPAGPVRVAVVGESLRRRIAADARAAAALDVRRSCDRLDQAGAMLLEAGADVLLLEVSELDDAAIPLIVAARQGAIAAAVVVMYRFCASATIRELRELGCLVARVPSEMGELVSLCRTAMAERDMLPRGPAPAQLKAAPAPRRFDDEALATLAAAGNRLQCECPRHLADLLLMVGSFERYSASCANRNEADARLHLDLEGHAGRARAILEVAMEQLALAEGLPLPPNKQ